MAENYLEGKVVVITGGAGGMGAVMTLSLIEVGARIVAIDVEQERLTELARKTSGSAGANALLPFRADIAQATECDRIVAEVLAKLGAIHALVNNAGIGMQTIRPDYLSRPIRFWETDPDRWQAMMDVNWKGAFLMARAVAPHLLKQGWGRIINVTTSLDTMYRTCYTPYGMSKAALEAATASWAKDLDHTGVTVNVLVPGGPTNTRFIPDTVSFDRRSLVQPEVMAAPIRWLVSDASNGFTGYRFVANQWDTALPAGEAAKKAGSPAAWQGIASKAVWPGSRQ